MDAHSKWPYMVEMMTTTSSNTSEALCKLFSIYGLPDQLISDNELQFTSDNFYDDQLSSLLSILSPFCTFSYSCDNNRVQYAIILVPLKPWTGDLKKTCMPMDWSER